MNHGYLSTLWPAEDGGPGRLQAVGAGASLGLRPGEQLSCTRRATLLSTMMVLGPGDEVYLLTHSALRSHLGLSTTACVERIDPLNLQTLQRSPRLAGGPMWPGGMALHANGDLIVVYGRHAHRLGLDCSLRQSRTLPEDQPYNGFVVLDNGLIVTKNLSETLPARLSVLDATSLKPAAADTLCPEPSVARLSARGNTVYVVGVRSVMRYHWSDSQQRLMPDKGWRVHYLGAQGHSFGWDLVLAADHGWFMDNGQHRYRWRMKGAGVSRSANRLHRVSLLQAQEHSAVEVCGLPGGSITNPPLIDVQRRIVVGYDSANARVQAWRVAEDGPHGGLQLQPLWHKHDFGCASHMLFYPASGELVLNDHHLQGEQVVVLDIDSGAEKGRVGIGGWSQGVVFPCPGRNRDFYWSSMSRLARVHVA